MNLRQRAPHVVALVAIGLCVSAVPALLKGEEGRAAIDPSVLAELHAKGEADFFVVFREQADLSAAHAIRDWNERGRFVYERLVATADSSQVGVRAQLGATNAEVTPFWIVNAIHVKGADGALVSLLAARPEVAAIVALPEVTLIAGATRTGRSEPDSTEGIESVEWNIDRIRAPLVWSTYGVRGEGIVIGSIDTGVQYDHPALVEHYRGNLGGGVFDHNYNWYDPDFVCGNPSIEPCDPDGHGTATTGVAAGDDGGDNQIGVAPGARFLQAAFDFDNPSAYGMFMVMQWMLAPTDLNGQNPNPDLRPHVVNNSWGWNSGNGYFRGAVQAWVASGIFPSFAAGNEGPTCNTMLSPGDYPESYAAGALGMNDVVTVFSSRGPSFFGPIKPDIAAPGEDIRTSIPGGAYLSGCWGTSFAAPHVTGTVALIWSLNPELIGQVETTRLHLDHSAIDTSDLACGGDPDDNNVYGRGRLDAFAAVSFLLIDSFESGDTSVWSATVP
jgi:subtilisin family serine protease